MVIPPNLHLHACTNKKTTNYTEYKWITTGQKYLLQGQGWLWDVEMHSWQHHNQLRLLACSFGWFVFTNIYTVGYRSFCSQVTLPMCNQRPKTHAVLWPLMECTVINLFPCKCMCLYVALDAHKDLREVHVKHIPQLHTSSFMIKRGTNPIYP